MQVTDKKIVIVSSIIRPNTGGGVINRRNIDMLGRLTREPIIFYVDGQGAKAQTGVVWKVFDRLRGVFGGLSSAYLREIGELVVAEQPDVVFLNQSLYGSVARLVKRLLPQTPVVTFFHNVEYLYFESESRNSPRSLSLRFAKISSKKAERLAVQYSDYLVAMNSRDSRKLDELYGRGADFLLPTSFEDRGPVEYTVSDPKKPLELLFVGFNFFANVQGIEWFCREVMPQCHNARLTVVGRGMESERERLESFNVQVVGSVEDLSSYYATADMVVSPIFIGSGMKTKTAEALMYGLPLLATSEALEGYELDASLVGARCDTAQEFIERITYFAAHKGDLVALSNRSRQYFVESYAHQVVWSKFASFFASTLKK